MYNMLHHSLHDEEPKQASLSQLIELQAQTIHFLSQNQQHLLTVTPHTVKNQLKILKEMVTLLRRLFAAPSPVVDPIDPILSLAQGCETELSQKRIPNLEGLKKTLLELTSQIEPQPQPEMHTKIAELLYLQSIYTMWVFALAHKLKILATGPIAQSNILSSDDFNIFSNAHAQAIFLSEHQNYCFANNLRAKSTSQDFVQDPIQFLNWIVQDHMQDSDLSDPNYGLYTRLYEAAGFKILYPSPTAHSGSSRHTPLSSSRNPSPSAQVAGITIHYPSPTVSSGFTTPNRHTPLSSSKNPSPSAQAGGSHGWSEERLPHSQTYSRGGFDATPPTLSPPHLLKIETANISPIAPASRSNAQVDIHQPRQPLTNGSNHSASLPEAVASNRSPHSSPSTHGASGSQPAPEQNHHFFIAMMIGMGVIIGIAGLLSLVTVACSMGGVEIANTVLDVVRNTQGVSPLEVALGGAAAFALGTSMSAFFYQRISQVNDEKSMDQTLTPK